MNVIRCISELLYQYDCVIVPGFGGFVTKQEATTFSPLNYEFQPPRKIVSFNSDLNHSDGLLANYVAKKYNAEYDQAIEWINRAVNNWKETLKKESTLELEKIGVFNQENGLLNFTPDYAANYLTDAFGLTTIKANYILREKQLVIQRKRNNSWMSYAAAVAFALMIGGGSFFANNQLSPNQLSSILPLVWGESNTEKGTVQPMENLKTEEYQAKATTAEIIIPEESKNIEIEEPQLVDKEESEEPKIKRNQVIGGSFKKYYKAMACESRLRRQGFEDAVIIGKVGNYVMVAYKTFDDRQEALEYKRELEEQGKDVFLR